MKVKKLWFDNERMYVDLGHNRVQSVALWRFPRLQQASEQQRASWQQISDDLRWDGLDEDICLESFFRDDNDPTLLRWNMLT